MKPVIFVKLGGSLITDKTKQFVVDNRLLSLAVEEIKEVYDPKKFYLVVGHGGGSFPHTLAKKYQTVNGFTGKQSIFGACLVEQAVMKLNSLVMEKFLQAGIPAINLSPLSTMIMKNKKVDQVDTQALEKALALGMLPIIYGDLVFDNVLGFTICSTEKILAAIALVLQKKGFSPRLLIHCGRTQGVYDNQGKTIAEINKANFDKIKNDLHGSGGIDVTGGMIHKVEESLELADKSIPSLIINGSVPGNLSKAILGKAVTGTRIEKSAEIVR